jgi:hypothetical protein
MNWFFTTFRAGDVVDVKNTTKNLDLHNGLGDWTLSWDNWLKGSALPAAPASPSPTASPSPAPAN